VQSRNRGRFHAPILSALLLLCASSLRAQSITYRPYIQPGDSGPFAPKDQMVVAWQTDESSLTPGAYAVQFGKSLTHLASAVTRARVVDDYLVGRPAVFVARAPIQVRRSCELHGRARQSRLRHYLFYR
jgi:hypothetical protein